MIDKYLIKNNRYEILTEKGFKDFDGLVVTLNKEVIDLVDYDLRCTPCHEIKLNDTFIKTSTLKHNKIDGLHKVFDLLNVDDGSEYITNDVTSHNCSILYVDETAFLANDFEFYDSVYPTISSGKNSKIIFTSTPFGQRGLFHKIYTESVEGKNSYANYFADYRANPNYDDEWERQTRSNTPPARFSQEFECKFLGSDGTLIPPQSLDKIIIRNPLESNETTKIYIRPDKNKNFVSVVDSAGGLGLDYSVMTIIDVTELPYKVAAIYRSNTISPLLFPHTIISLATKYNECPVLVESNGEYGGQVANILYYDLEYEGTILSKTDVKTKDIKLGSFGRPTIGVKTTKKVKAIGCSNLKGLIENELLDVSDADALSELGTFIESGNSYAAMSGCNDDIVMTLVLFSWFVKQDIFTEYSNTNMFNKIYELNEEQLFEDLVPLGIMPSYEPEFEPDITYYRV